MAIPFLLSGVEKTTAAQLWDNAAGFNCALANISLLKGEMATAGMYIQQAREAARKAADDDNFFKLYSSLSQYHRQSGNPALALMYQDSALQYKSQIETDRDYRLKVQAEYTFANDKHAAESARLKAETQHQRRIRNSIIGIVFLLMIVALLLYNRQRLRHAYHEQILGQERRKAEQELAIAQHQLDDFTQNLKDKNALIEKFSADLQKLQERSAGEFTPEQSAILDELRLSAILTDAHWEDFRQRFEKVHGGFLQRLRIKLPDLSPAETRFMALAKLQLNNKEMASILGISPDSIRMMRHRLRKKLALTEEGSLEELINSV
jgi:DNA-binding CsgD family transcriptional regulator/cell division protein FtsB